MMGIKILYILLINVKNSEKELLTSMDRMGKIKGINFKKYI
jgi:hypothetical protein